MNSSIYYDLLQTKKLFVQLVKVINDYGTEHVFTITCTEFRISFLTQLS